MIYQEFEIKGGTQFANDMNPHVTMAAQLFTATSNWSTQITMLAYVLLGDGQIFKFPSKCASIVMGISNLDAKRSYLSTGNQNPGTAHERMGTFCDSSQRNVSETLDW